MKKKWKKKFSASALCSVMPLKQAWKGGVQKNKHPPPLLRGSDGCLFQEHPDRNSKWPFPPPNSCLCCCWDMGTYSNHLLVCLFLHVYIPIPYPIAFSFSDDERMWMLIRTWAHIILQRPFFILFWGGSVSLARFLFSLHFFYNSSIIYKLYT